MLKFSDDDGATWSEKYWADAFVITEASLAAPEWVGLEQSDAGVVTLQWNAVEGADGYVIYMASEENGEDM